MKKTEKVRKFFKVNFLSGILVVVPLAVSIYVLVRISRWLYTKLVFLPINTDRIIELLSEFLPGWAVAGTIKALHLVEFGLVLLLMLFIISLMGMITKNRLGRWIVGTTERILDRIPLVGMIYSALKQLMEAVFSGKGDFSRVVMIEYPRRGIWSLGFVSREADKTLSEKALGKDGRLLSIFIPTTPNPTSGFLLMVPKEDVIDLELSIEQAFKMIISAGMVHPHEAPKDALATAEEGGVLGKMKDLLRKKEEEPQDENQE